MSLETIDLKILEFYETIDLRRKRELATEILNKSSDPDLIREMEEYIKFNDIFKISP